MLPNNVFPVGKKIYCVWGPDIIEKNRDFIRGIDYKYFDYVCAVHRDQLDGDDALHAALAIRSNYFLCLETFFTLIGALLQAPRCVPGWFLKAKTGTVRSVAAGLEAEDIDFPIAFRPRPTPLSWKFISAVVNGQVNWPDLAEETVENFATVWAWLSRDFLDPNNIAEYNSIKHGFRAQSGGFSIKIQLDNPPPAWDDTNIINLGSSHFGSSYLLDEPIGDAAKMKNDPSFILTHNSLNWKPQHLLARTRLASMSIRNIRAFLLTAVCKQEPEVFERYNTRQEYTAPWMDDQCDLINSSFGYNVNEADIVRPTREELSKIITESCA